MDVTEVENGGGWCMLVLPPSGKLKQLSHFPAPHECFCLLPPVACVAYTCVSSSLVHVANITFT